MDSKKLSSSCKPILKRISIYDCSQYSTPWDLKQETSKHIGISNTQMSDATARHIMTRTKLAEELNHYLLELLGLTGEWRKILLIVNRNGPLGIRN